jgi:hypothetical protein
MNKCWEVGVQIHIFLISAPYFRSPSQPGRFDLARARSTHRFWGWEGPRTSLGSVDKGLISPLYSWGKSPRHLIEAEWDGPQRRSGGWGEEELMHCREWNPDHPARMGSLYRLSLPDCFHSIPCHERIISPWSRPLWLLMSAKPLIPSHCIFKKTICNFRAARCSVLDGTLCYMPEDRGFETRWGYWIFSIYSSRTSP